MKNSYFIVVDGIDGSGKSEMVKMLHNHLFSKSKKFRILTTREPTNGEYGKKIRQMLIHENDPFSSSNDMTELFIKDREMHLKNTILPFLSKTDGDEINIAISDRYYHSTIAFQSAQGMDMQEMIDRNKNFLKPDITFILDVNPEIALKRIEYRKKEKFEQLQFMHKIRNNFLQLPEILEANIKIVDSNRPMRQVFNDVKKDIDALIGN
jgi:dTMP kinase